MNKQVGVSSELWIELELPNRWSGVGRVSNDSLHEAVPSLWKRKNKLLEGKGWGYT